MVWTTYYLSLIDWSQISIPYAVIRLVTGMAIFSLVEYILHRFLFHSENYLPNNRLVRYLHFILHGIHHMLPVDP
jgi:4-hydroxysphinganine ceramide fatty acyl 2-hydroxylase